MKTETSHIRLGWTAAGSGKTPAGFPVHTVRARHENKYFTDHTRIAGRKVININE